VWFDGAACNNERVRRYPDISGLRRDVHHEPVGPSRLWRLWISWIGVQQRG
jgi:hypothetical protein